MHTRGCTGNFRRALAAAAACFQPPPSPDRLLPFVSSLAICHRPTMSFNSGQPSLSSQPPPSSDAAVAAPPGVGPSSPAAAAASSNAPASSLSPLFSSSPSSALASAAGSGAGDFPRSSSGSSAFDSPRARPLQRSLSRRERQRCTRAPRPAAGAAEALREQRFVMRCVRRGLCLWC
jgi:hypothetical protein